MKSENDNQNKSASERGLSIRLFGAFETRVNDSPIPPLRSRKVQWLLALLVLRHDQALDRAWLAGTLWPESAPDQALYNLRQSLSNLRRALNGTGLHFDAPAVNALSLNLAGAVADVIAFDAAIADGTQAGLERAVGLYRGPLLEGCDEEWAVSERRVREESYLSALAGLADQSLAQGETDRAIAYLRTAVQADPFRERTQRALLQALAGAGEVGEALQAYRDLRTLLRRELNADPDPDTVTLFQRIQQEARSRTPPLLARSAPPRSAALFRLPAFLTDLVGRKPDVKQVAATLRAARLLTLTGPGGVGKTRLAVAAAEQMTGMYPDGIFFADLAPISDPALIAQTIISALQAREASGRSPMQALQEHLQSKTLLLLLDNCEHLLDGCARLVNDLLTRCPGVSVLATSRQILGLTGEARQAVSPLTTPVLSELPTEDGQGEKEWLSLLGEYEAVQLFVMRARQARPAFQMSARNAPIIAQICARLDGMPLALELAAARVRSLSIEEINARLDDRFRLLTGGSRAALPRQQTLRALMDWSYDLLSEGEKTLLCRVAVFAGGWTLDAAEQICAGNGQGGHESIEAGDILDVLTGLADKSLVVYDAQGEGRYEEQAGTSRYRLLETVRQYARERLETSGEAAAWRTMHRDYFLRLAEQAEDEFRGPEQASWLERLEAEHGNLRAALDFCQDLSQEAKTGMRLAAALEQFWWAHGHAKEGRDRLASALARPDAQKPTWERAHALRGAGSLAWMQGDYAGARTWYEASLRLGRQLEDRSIIAGALGNLGSVISLQGDYATARPYFEESLTIKKELGDTRGIAHTLMGLGNVTLEQSDYTAARSFSEQSLTLMRELEDKQGVARCLINLGNVAMAQGEYDEARSFFEGSLEIQSELGYKRGVARSLSNLGNVAMAQGEYDAARRHLERSLALQRELGDKGGAAPTLCNLGSLLSRQGEYSAAQACLRECLTSCREIGAKWIMAYALEGCAELACRQHRVEQAVPLYGAAHSLRKIIGSPLSPSESGEHERNMAAARAATDERTFQTLWEKGEAITLNQAVEYALYNMEKT